jgi:hypothetical protein
MSADEAERELFQLAARSHRLPAADWGQSALRGINPLRAFAISAD